MKKRKLIIIFLITLLSFLVLIPITSSQDIVLTEYQTTSNDILSIHCNSPTNYRSFAQVFELGITGPTEDYYITKVQLQMYMSSSPLTIGNLYVDIRNTSSNLPVGGDNNYLVRKVVPVTTIGGASWYNFVFAIPVLLHYGTRYAITAWTDTTDTNSAHWIAWMARGGDNWYDGATDCIYRSSGAPHTNGWTDFASYDATFKLYGYNATSPLAFGIPTPENNADNQHLAFNWQIGMIEVNGDLFNWTIECNNGQQSGANEEYNGTKSLSLSGLAFSTTYQVWVNATDGFYWTNETYFFKTRVAEYPPLPPTVGDEYPANNTNYVLINTDMNVMVFDPNNDTMNVSFYWINDSTIHGIHNTANGTIAGFMTIDYSMMSHDTEYTWYVNVTDGMFNVTSDVFTFHTCRAWDLNGDGTTNYLDISSLVSHYGETVSPSGYEPWDINNDGDTNYLDISSLVSHYGESY